MRYLSLPHSVGLLCLLVAGCSTETTTASRPTSQPDAGRSSAGAEYRTGRASRDGIGKFYFDREIAQVMGHRGARWLERPARQSQERTDLLISKLPLRSSDVVADIGAGTGYFSFPVATRVPDGRVYAVDIQPEMLAIISERARSAGIANVEPVLGDEQSVRLPAAVLDLAFIVDAYHEFSHPREMGTSLVRALKPGGLLVLVEYRAEDPSVPIKTLHKMSEAQVRREVTALGLRWERTESYLPQQHVLVFRKPS
ncbi:MAG: methyltransferase domain-containing protein [Pseudomonadota bacterium]